MAVGPSCPDEPGRDPIAPPVALACCEAIALVVDDDAADDAGEACGAKAYAELSADFGAECSEPSSSYVF